MYKSTPRTAGGSCRFGCTSWPFTTKHRSKAADPRLIPQRYQCAASLLGILAGNSVWSNLDILIPCVFADAAPANSVLKTLFLSLSPYQQDRIQNSVPSGVVDYTVLCKKFMSFCLFEMLSVVPAELKTNLIYWIEFDIWISECEKDKSNTPSVHGKQRRRSRKKNRQNNQMEVWILMDELLWF